MLGRSIRSAVTAGIAASLVWCGSVTVFNQPAQDWPQWRGPNRDGISPVAGLLKQWPAEGPPLAWRTQGAGEGYSSMSTAGGRLYTMGAQGGTEYVVAFDLASGKKLWQVAHGQRYDNDRGSGPRGTPTTDGDRLYVLGATGELASLEAASGKKVWSVNVLKEFGGSNPRWGISESPLVTLDRVIVNAGGPSASIVALEKRTGRPIWKSQSDEAGYSSAILHRFGGVDQVIMFTARRVVGVDVQTGKLLWEYAGVANRVANVATPIVHDNLVFVSSAYDTGAALIRLDAAGGSVKASEVYFTRNMMNHHASSVLVGDHVYGFNNAILTALRLKDGEPAWRDRSVGKGSVIFADQRLYLFSENGVVGLAEASPTGYAEKGRFRIQQGSQPTWSHPIIAQGKLLLRDQDTIYAYDVEAE
jgi:outer membrane protein assembly factor BamB